MTKLGSNQAALLNALRQHKCWSRSSGWIWSTRNHTEKMLKVLVTRGLVRTETYEETDPITKAKYPVTLYSPVEGETK